MHAVFMGTTAASRNGGGGDASLQSDVFEIPEVIDKTGWAAQRHTTFPYAGMKTLLMLRARPTLWRHMTSLQYCRFIRGNKFMTN